MGGVIAAGSQVTAAAGAAMLRQGGNAVDAAVAAAFASFIAEMGVVHWGGSGLAQVYDPLRAESVVYDFFSNMPGLGSVGPAKLDFEQVTVDFGSATQSFFLGRGSVAVPGNLFGLCRMAADYGSRPLSTLLEPALQLARQGFIISRFQAETSHLLAPLYTHTAEMRAIYQPHGRLVQAGDHVFVPDLYATLQQLAVEGENFMRHGALGRALVDDQTARGGLISAEDLSHYAVIQSAPIRVPYREYEIWLPPPCSSGGVLLAFAFHVLAALQINKLQAGSADHLQLLTEVMAATSRARNAWENALAGGDPQAAVATFLQPDAIAPYIEEVRAALRDQRPSPIGQEPKAPEHTSHLSVVDDQGMAVSLTTTAGESAGYVVPGTGFIPNNMLGEEDLNPHGWHRWQPGQRIPTMMAPTMVLLDGKIRLVTGSGGSARIRSAILQTISHVLDSGLGLDEAVNRPRIHLDGAVLQCEGGYDEAAVATLAGRGYAVNRWPRQGIYFGGAHSVSRTPEGRLVGAGDRRREGEVGSA